MTFSAMGITSNLEL